MEKGKRTCKLKLVFVVMIVSILCIGMGVTVYADVHVDSVNVTGMGNRYSSVPAGNTIDVVDYSDTSCTIHSMMGYEVNESTKVTINGKTAKFSRKENDGVLDYYTFVVSSSSDDDEKKEDKKEEHSEPASWVKNPDEMGIGGFSGGASFVGTVNLGKQEQGPLGKLAFAQNRPVGWSEAFSFNMTVNGKADFTAKNGTLSITVPKQFIKAGRKFALLAIEQDGTVKLYNDMDTSDSTVTILLNGTAYAYDLIYIG